MRRTGRILIFFIPGCFDEAIEVNLERPEPESVLLVRGSGLLNKRQRSDYREVAIRIDKNGKAESSEELTARVFEMSPKEVTKYSIPRRVFEALKDARSTSPRQTISVRRG
ncbi:hypothetical protein DRH29_04450 [candidate division Kazan bacterium]|uniref:Uncharacterized protein n=1 Tax=candidate division Kazan bacterium TaxID=2202143 RepID=A0A420ZBU1_UNCK3|nr:MAG: hypothetical protein DRH29_04450 [candidate division Kazan bacterium]